MRRQNKRIVYALFVSVGLGLLLAAYILNLQEDTKLLGDIAKDIRIVVISLALIDILWNFVGGDPLSDQIDELRAMSLINQDSKDTGLDRILNRSAAWESEFTNLFLESKHTIDVSGWSLQSMADNGDLKAIVADKLSKGVKIRLLIYHPDNPILPYAGVDDDKTKMEAVRKQMQASWSRFQQIRSDLPDKHKNKFEVKRLVDGVMYCGIRRTDNTVTVLPYSFELATSTAPLYKIVGSEKSLFRNYTLEFDSLFERASED